jgi:hypothetical protein
VDFAEGVLRDGLADTATVSRTLLDYGWERPLGNLADDATLFSKLMEKGEFVATIVSPRTSVENERLAPVMVTRQLLFQLGQKGLLAKPSLSRADAIAVSEEPVDTLIESFLAKFAGSKDMDIPAMSRCRVAERQYLLLTHRLRANRDLVRPDDRRTRSSGFRIQCDSIKDGARTHREVCHGYYEVNYKRKSQNSSRKTWDSVRELRAGAPAVSARRPPDCEASCRVRGVHEGKCLECQYGKDQRCKGPFHVLHLKYAEDPIDSRTDCPFCAFLSVRLLDSPYAK